jgi:hypothetical protein
MPSFKIQIRIRLSTQSLKTTKKLVSCQLFFSQITFRLFFIPAMTMSDIGSPSRESPINSFYDEYMNLLPKDAGSQRDISGEAVWSLSSCKVGK